MFLYFYLTVKDQNISYLIKFVIMKKLITKFCIKLFNNFSTEKTHMRSHVKILPY